MDNLWITWEGVAFLQLKTVRAASPSTPDKSHRRLASVPNCLTLRSLFRSFLLTVLIVYDHLGVLSTGIYRFCELFFEIFLADRG